MKVFIYHIKKDRWFYIAWAIVALIIILSGCKSLEKAQNRVINSGTLPDLCAKFYPATVSKGDTIYSIDTAYIKLPPDLSRDTFHILYGDTVLLPSAKTIQRITITKIVHDTIIDQAKLKSCQNKWEESVKQNSVINSMLTEANRKLVKSEKEKMWAIGIIIALIVVPAVIIFIRGKII